MAPLDLSVVRWQTDEIFKCLFEDDEQPVLFRSGHNFSDVETDGPDESSQDFDPAAIAEKLRSVADKLNDDMIFKAVLDDFKKAAAQEAVETAFSHSVEALCKNQALSPELSLEMQSVRTGLAFAHYAINACPGLKNKIRAAMQSLVHKQDKWVSQQGGWDKVKI